MTSAAHVSRTTVVIGATASIAAKIADQPVKAEIEVEMLVNNTAARELGPLSLLPTEIAARAGKQIIELTILHR
ncbi:hypothetical protein [Nesterenkonia haasae]|uniref:hypothetical protein n=1 Tax=Nesterenkonia haasae TaxID=2587813 RepID=UPI001391F56A|nr:hypothetical protein [Nesterenkonia haasae]NDK32788.1 hypothetical protein [Nesterenkonia haasae]